MKALLDTSVLVAAMIEAHPAHERALPWLQQARAGQITASVASHTLAELYAVLTRLPLQPPISPPVAWQLIQQNVLTVFEIVSLSEDDYRTVLEHLSQQNIRGGATYAALIAYAASKTNADQLVTLNEKDFLKVYPDLAERIVVP